jgi:hypothetical protein
MTKPGLANAQRVDALVVDAQVVDEFAETQVLVDKSPQRPAVDDEATAQSVYSEYVQELERMLKAETAK